MKKQIKFDAFKRQANEYLKKHFGSTLEDLMIDDSDVQNAFDNKETPEEYIEWMAEKYNFTRKKDFSLNAALRVVGNFQK